MFLWRLRFWLFGLALVVAAGLLPAQAENIGSTIVVVRTVTGQLETVVRQLVLHDNVAQNEIISTAPDAASEIEFVDGTKLRLGPRAKVTLDKFVYDPNPSKGAFYLTATEGVFRFTTGTMAHQSYSIKTPNGTLGVRGTDFNVFIGAQTIVSVIEGLVVATSNGGNSQSFGPGSYFTMGDGPPGFSNNDDKSTIDGQVGLMDTYITAGQFANAGGAPGSGPPQTFFQFGPGASPCVTPTRADNAC